MRHGLSPSAADAGVEFDALRPISERGRADARRTAQEIAKRGGRPGLILHSPLTRAVQTAAAVAEVLKPARGTASFAPLDNTRPAEEVFTELTARTDGVDEVLAIGHQPQIGELAAMLTETRLDFRPAGLAVIAPGPRRAAARQPPACGA